MPFGQDVFNEKGSCKDEACSCRKKDYDKDKLTWLWHHTSLEDEYIINRNSEGVNSRFFKPGPYHPEFEDQLQAFVSWYLHTLESTLNL